YFCRHRHVLVAANLDPDRNWCRGRACPDQLDRQLRWVCRSGYHRSVEGRDRGLRWRASVPRRSAWIWRRACPAFRTDGAAKRPKRPHRVANFLLIPLDLGPRLNPTWPEPHYNLQKCIDVPTRIHALILPKSAGASKFGAFSCFLGADPEKTLTVSLISRSIAL